MFALFCLLLFVGAMVHSRCVLIVFSICGLFSIIILWLLASVYVASAVALADFCHQPTPFVQYALGEQLDYDVTEYYLKCKPGASNPFDNFISVSNGRSIDPPLGGREGKAIRHAPPTEAVARMLSRSLARCSLYVYIVRTIHRTIHLYL